jgi:hypothetical protein
MARRIARDATIAIQFGGVDDGSVITWGTATQIEGKCSEISIDYRSQNVNLAGLSDAYARMRSAGTAEYTIRIRAFIPADSFDFYVSGNPPLHQRVRVRIKPLSTLATEAEFTGVITKWSWSAQAGQEQIEEIEIVGPLDV